jgi:hypothetical protein
LVDNAVVLPASSSLGKGRVPTPTPHDRQRITHGNAERVLNI